MKGWPMYQEIKQLKELGLNKSQVERKLNIDWKTVDKYWNLSPDDFAAVRGDSAQRTKYLDRYKERILQWLHKHSDLSAAQVQDWLKEHYRDYVGSERSVRRYLSQLRKEYGIVKPLEQRQYRAVEDPPMGCQAQLDLGQIKLLNSQGQWVTVYGFGLVLSHSRYKYVEWSDRPFTTARLIQVFYRALEYIGGVPAEIVYDQDKLLVASENYGEIIHTAEFERFRQAMGFKVYVCRRNDPESKGRIEAVIKYAKKNYAKNRVLADLESFNAGCLDWLSRRANAEKHGTTKKIPAQVFDLEREHLRPIPVLMTEPEEIITRGVRKDNAILYTGNRYALPLGTYAPGKKVAVKEASGYLEISDLETGQLLVKHRLASGKGQLVGTNNQRRDYNQRLAELYDQVLASLGDSREAARFLEQLRNERPRYVRDQYQLVLNTTRQHSRKSLVQALSHCIEREIWSAVEFRSAAEHFTGLADEEASISGTDKVTVPPSCQIKAEIRDIGEYVALYGGITK